MDRNHALPQSRSIVSLGILTALACAFLLASTGPVLADERPSRLERQVGVMERAIDDMLVDSPNFLVSGRHVTEGMEDEDLGAVFFFRASLTGPGWDEHGRTWSWPWDRKHKIIVLRDKDDGKDVEAELEDAGVVIRDGDVYIISKGDKKRLKDLVDEEDAEVLDSKSYREKQLKKYERAKAEMVEVLMEAGDVLRALPAGRTVKMVGRMHDLDLPKEMEVRKITVSASIDDLRAHADGKLSAADMKARIQVKES